MPELYERVIITPSELVPPRGYSHGVMSEIVRDGGIVVAHLSMAGQTGSDISGKIARPGELVGQIEDTLVNMEVIAGNVGVDLRFIDTLRMDTTDIEEFQRREREIGALWRKFFKGYYPPTALIEARRLYDPAAMIEVTGSGIVRVPENTFDELQSQF